MKLKDPKDWKIAGKPVKRLDTLDKVTGKQIYGIDYTMPGMLVATVRACPVIGGKLKSFDAAKVEKMPGVKKVVAIDGNAVVVVADTYWNARTALAALPAEWDVGKLGEVQNETITAMLKEGLDATEAFVGNKVGDAKAAIDGAAKKVDGDLRLPLPAPCHHGADERHGALHRRQVRGVVRHAERRGGAGRCVGGLRSCRSPSARSTSMMLGGGFGRRGRADYVRQAVLVAKEMPGTPVKLMWSREEDMTHCQYHPTTMCKLTGGLDAQGNLVGLHVRISGQSILASLLPQNLHERHGSGDLPGPDGNGRRSGLRLQRAEPADRPRHAQPAHHAGLLARRERQPERRLHGMLHGRAGRGGRTGSAGLPPEDCSSPSGPPC